MIFIKNIFKICFVIIGTIIGAGFASGKEIYSFFCVYGTNGFLGILISISLISFIIYKTFKIVLDNKINTYSDFTKLLISHNKMISYTINNIMNIFLFISFVVMVSGFGSFFKQDLNIPIFIGSTIICLLALITFFKNINGIIKTNTILIPILIFLIIVLGLKNNVLFFNIKRLPFHHNLNWLFKSILYASYNSIILIPMIINLKPLIANKKQIKYIALITFIFMQISSLILYFILSKNIMQIQNLDIPLFFIANKYGLMFKYLYGFSILIGIFTTAVSSGFSFLNNIAKTKKQYIFFAFFICIIAIILSNIGFSILLNTLYPVLGILGLLQFIVVFLHKKNRDA